MADVPTIASSRRGVPKANPMATFVCTSRGAPGVKRVGMALDRRSLNRRALRDLRR